MCEQCTKDDIQQRDTEHILTEATTILALANLGEPARDDMDVIIKDALERIDPQSLVAAVAVIGTQTFRDLGHDSDKVDKLLFRRAMSHTSRMIMSAVRAAVADPKNVVKVTGP